MCLILKVRVPAAERATLAAAAAAVPAGALHVELVPASRWPWARPRDAEATVSEEGGCACSLLADDADWDAPVWAMRPEVREPLAQTLETLASGIPSGTVIEALWVGESAGHDQHVTPAGLAALVRADSLGTRTRYVVSGGPRSNVALQLTRGRDRDPACCSHRD